MLTLALLEVMDKEVTVPEAWILAGLCAAAGVLLSRWKPWLVAVPLLVLVVAAWSIASELLDPFVGPAIRAEAGSGYPFRVFLPVCLAAFGLGGILLGKLRRRKRAA